ncbi:MAG: hypothetical protein U0Q16_11620 [Bryobacteraceae bacterium]
MEIRFSDAINSEHPEYRAKAALWKQYRDLYVGGEQLRASASEYLARRPKEPGEVYTDRLARVFYENYVGSIVDWYVATLFRREPIVLVEGDEPRSRKFLSEFTDDCDLRGTSLTEFFRKQILEALVCGVSYTLVDFPRIEQPAANLAEEDEGGWNRAYLSSCTAEQLINWSVDERGDFEWVVMRTSTLRKASVDSASWDKETRWLYFDRENFRVYRSVQDGPNASGVSLVDAGRHAMADQRRVPLYPLRVPEGLWLLNKAGLLQLEHFNKSNALAWALTMGLFATPVIYSEREWRQVVSESYYIQLGPNDRFGWTEPEGKVFQVATDNLRRLQEEIYRVCYVLHQAGGALSQSGLAKQRDFAITQEVLRGLGDIVKDTMRRVLKGVTDARRDQVTVGVSGLDEFDIGEFGGELADAERLLGLGIGSKTLRKQVFQKLAFKYLCDVRQEVKEQIAKEIEEGMEVKQG